MIDLHAHVLAAVDDGPRTLDEAVEALAAASAGGVSVVAATPHVSERYPTTPDSMERELARTVAAVDERRLPMRLVGGGEVDAGLLLRLSPGDLCRFSLGGGGYLLVALPWEGVSAATMTSLRGLAEHGLRPVIAHPERYADVQDRPGRANSLVANGCLLQVTASSLVGLHGRAAATAARALLEHDLVHIVASDMHGRSMRRAGLGEARHAIGSEDLAQWLTVEVPQAVLDGIDLPPRPSPRKRRLRFR